MIVEVFDPKDKEVYRQYPSKGFGTFRWRFEYVEDAAAEISTMLKRFPGCQILAYEEDCEEESKEE